MGGGLTRAEGMFRLTYQVYGEVSTLKPLFPGEPTKREGLFELCWLMNKHFAVDLSCHLTSILLFCIKSCD